MRTANKSPKIPYSATGNGKVIVNSYPGPDHHQKIFQFVVPIMTTSFNEMGSILCQ